MLGRLLLPLIYPLAAAAVAYFARIERRKWQFVSVLKATAGEEPSLRKRDIQSVIRALKNSYSATCVIYLMVWIKEVTDLWHSHPWLTASVICLLFTLAPSREGKSIRVTAS